MLNLRARWYDPGMGVFLSKDPIESEPPYQYVRGNPSNLVDPSGFAPHNPAPSHPDCIGEEGPRLPRTHQPDIQPLHCFDGSSPRSRYQPIIHRPSNSLLTTVINSHFQLDDGLILGFSVAYNDLIQMPFNLALPELFFEKWVMGDGMCVPATGVTGGVEIVYDFKHLEKGLFSYYGSNFNDGTIRGAGGTSYVGKARGFKTQSYADGVGAYGGYFGGVAGSIGLGDIVSGVVIEAAPLHDDSNRTLNPDGVFASYIGIGAGVGLSAPINFDIAVTNYTLWYRESYLFGASRVAFDDKGYEPLKKDYSNRVQAAIFMTAELSPLTVNLSNTPVANIVRQSIGELWQYVGDPNIP